MSLQRPVISTYIAGIPELVVPGEHGWLIPTGDVEALSNAIEQCLRASPEDIARMGERGRTRVVQRHDIGHALGNQSSRELF